MRRQWEFCIVSTPPPGPVEVYVSYMKVGGMERHVYKAKNWDDGAYRLMPELLAQLGLDGWQIQYVDQSGAYYMQREISDEPPPT